MNNQIFYFFYNINHQSVFLNGVIIFFADIFPYVLIVSVGFFYYVISDPENDFQVFVRKNSRELFRIFLSVVLAWILAEILKILIHTERPFVALSNVQSLIPETGYSFPSSHVAFFSALAVALFFKNKKMGYLFMFFALIIGLARIMAGVHFPIDILGGFVIGTAVALAIKKIT